MNVSEREESFGPHMATKTSWKQRYVHLSVLSYLILFTTVLAQSRPLEGEELKCCTLIEDPITYEERNGKHAFGFAGISMDYLTLLQEKLGFRCKTLELFKARNESNQGFTGFVYELEECTRNGTIIDLPGCQCEIGVGGWSLNEERVGRVDFVSSFADDDFRVLTHVDNISFRSSSRDGFFISAFSYTVWFAIFGLIACFIFLSIFDTRIIPPDPSLRNLPSDANMMSRIKDFFMNTELLGRLKKAMKNTLLEIVGQPTTEVREERTCTGWLLTYVLLLCGMFLALCYEAAMTASLVQEVESSEFRTIDDLKTCRIPARDVCIPSGGADEALWNSLIANQPCHEGASTPTVVDKYEDGHRKVASKECKFFMASGATTRSAENGRYCGQVATTGEPFSQSGMSFLLPKGSHMTEIFDRATLQLRLSDGIDTIDRYFRKKGECATPRNVSLNFRRLRLFFISAFAICLFLFLLMVFFPQGKQQGDSNGMNASRGKSNTSYSPDYDSAELSC